MVFLLLGSPSQPRAQITQIVQELEATTYILQQVNDGKYLTDPPRRKQKARSFEDGSAS